MKKLLSVFAWTLALNFLALIGGLAILYRAGNLNKEKVHQIKELVFAPATQPTEEAVAAVRDPATQPTLKLEEMLAKVSGRSASEQVEFMQRTFDAQMAVLDRRFQELQSQRKTVEDARTQIDQERKALGAGQQKLAAAQQQEKKIAEDKVRFAWAGGTEYSQGHYYRLQGPVTVIEFNNTEDDANHAHSVWRDPTNDFGRDLLMEHLVGEHRDGGTHRHG